MKSISIFGLGWLGVLVAERFEEEGWDINGTVRKPENINPKSNPLRTISVFSYPSLTHIPTCFYDADLILLCIPPGKCPDYLGMINFMVTKFNTGGAKELFFTSSTSVYSGKIAEAKETDTTEPETEIGRLLRKAEELLVSSSVKPIHILRLAGLIGKNRHPGKFLAGKKDLLNPTGIVNLVQGTDVAEIIWQLKDANLENTIVNVCSPEHPTRAEYYTKQAENLGLLPPTFLYENSVAGKRISGEKLAAKLPNFSFSSILN